MIGFEEQMAILERGVEQVAPREEFVRKLKRSIDTGKPLRVKYGIDPTGIDVHLGHTVPLRKLRQFQDLGHQAVIIIGNYTALVGDPSGRDETRKALTREQVEENAKDYLRQVGRIIDLDKAEVHANGDWFSKWTFLDVLDLTRKMTLGRISAREDFAKRIKEEKPVYLHECLYPLMQGWDSVEIRADVELGGTEQLFSLLVARDLQEGRDQEPQVAMTMPILVGTDGTRRMGKSLGNYIGVAEDPVTQFAKVMSIPDEPMRQYFTLLTDLPLSEVDGLLASGSNPRDVKERLGKAIVAQYSGVEAADHAAAEFRRRAAGDDPDEIPEFEVALDPSGEPKLLAQLFVGVLGFDTSTSNVRRMLEQGGVNVGPERSVVRDPKTRLELDPATRRVRVVQTSDSLELDPDQVVVRYGKRKIARLRIV
ncbi:MAG: tyrosine--tRNA ligase [Isosphaeraceae bacterium]|nr:tyrosine--tRNA ligase [Isosphaeraceae bacterium]